MRLARRLAASIIAINFAGDALAQDSSESPAPTPLASRLTDDLIKKAVKDTLAAEPKPKHGQLDGRALSGDSSYQKFLRKFSDARIPSCRRPDALKHQPTSVEFKGWVVGVSGELAAPFWLYAAASGKCRLSTD